MNESKKWKIITLMIGILSVLSPFIYPLVFNSQKSISYEIIDTVGISTKYIKLENLKMSINDKKIEDIFITTIKILNNGSVPISSKDYEKNLKISFDKNTTVYSAKIVKTNPNNIAIKYEIEDNNSIVISPILLNQSDYYNLNIYSSSFKKPKITARIIGVKDIKEQIDSSEKSFKKYLTITSSVFLMILMGYFLGTFIKIRHYLSYEKYLYLFSTFIIEYASLALLKTQVDYQKTTLVIMMLIAVITGYLFKLKELKSLNSAEYDNNTLERNS